MGKRKASKKKSNKKGEGQDSSNQNLHANSNLSSHSQGCVDDPKSWEDRDSDGGEREREEEEIVDQQEVDTDKDERLEEDVVQVAIEEKSFENGSSSADYSAVNVAEENPIVISTREEDSVATSFGIEDKEVAVVEEDEKYVIPQIFQFGEQKLESSTVDDKATVDYAEEDAAVEFNESVGPQINGDSEEEGLSKELVELAPKEFASAGAEGSVMPVPADVLDSGLRKRMESSISQISDDKEEFPSAFETEKSKQIESQVEALPIDDHNKSAVAPVVSNSSQTENLVEALPIDDQAKSEVAQVVSNGAQIAKPVEAIPVYDEARSAVAPVVSNGAPLETDNLGGTVSAITSREVGNGKDLEIQKKPFEDQPRIGTNPLPVRRTSWMGCCGLFEVFQGAK